MTSQTAPRSTLRTASQVAPSPSSGPAIETTGLTRRFGTFTAVDSLDLTIPAGIVYGMLGPNGAGKSTALRMITTLLAPSGGTARVLGHDVVRERHAVRSVIGVTGQYASVDEMLTGVENLRLFGRLLGLSRRRARAPAGRASGWTGEGRTWTGRADGAVRTGRGSLHRRPFLVRLAA